MDILNAVVTAAVLGIVGWLVVVATRGKVEHLQSGIDDLKGRVGELGSTMEKRFEAVDRRFERVEASLDGLRSDLTQVALAVGARPREATNG